MNYQSEVDVLIVGAGPTGLLTACELTRRGISCRIIEKRKEKSPLSKALAVHARTLEVMELIGIADKFVERGYAAPGINVTSRTKNQKAIAIDMYRLDTNYPYVLILPQNETEEILESHLDSLGILVERDTILECFEEREGCVYSQINRGEVIRSRFLVGCDGAHSVVREQLNLPFIGEKYDLTAFIGDVKIEGNYIKGHIQNFGSSRGFGILLPFRDDYFRIITMDHTKQQRTKTNHLDLEDLQETIDAISPEKLRLKDPRWLSRFGTSHQQVNHYSVGNVFLVGDAAHVHAPAGGQGMNTGLQDAFNLAWKLALTINNNAPDKLLDTYHEERHPIGASVLKFTDRFLRNFLIRNPIARSARDLIAKTIIPTELVQTKLGERLSGIGLNYRFTEESKRSNDSNLPKHARQAGDRLPNLELRGEKDTIKLYQLLREPWFKIFFFLSIDQLHQDQPKIQQLLQEIKQIDMKLLQPYLILNEGVPESIKTEIPTYIDFKKEFQLKTGVSHNSILLVRPDGYLAAHRLGWDKKQLFDILQDWMKWDERS